MSDSDYEDELPSIPVLSQDKVMSDWSMPSAETLATQRAREEQCEMELLRLREDTEDTPLAVMRCDSSGSEGEAALAAAVRELQVQQPTNSVPDTTQFVSALIQRLEAYDTRLLEQYSEVLQTNDHSLIVKVTDDILGSVCGLIWHDENSWGEAEMMVVGSWLCAVTFAVRGITRPLHALLDERASATHVQDLATVVCEVASPLLLLELSDRALSGAGRGADSFSRALLRHVVRTLAPHQETEWDSHPELSISEVSARLCEVWRGLGPAQREIGVRAAGRALALCPRGSDAERAAARCLLDAVTQPQSLRDKNRPEIQELHLGVTKLQLLFCDKHPMAL